MEWVCRSTSPFQNRVTVGVVGCVHHVLAAIQLDDDQCFQANEIANVTADRMLSPELEAVQLASPQVMPEKPFGIRCIVAQFAGVVVHLLIMFQ
jgi:hypothetical protein